MSKSKHTPGAWSLSSAETYTVRDTDGGAICQLKWLRGAHGLGGRRTDEEVMANACLIAAAPQILEALQRLANAADDVGVRFFDTDTEEPEVTAMRLATEQARAVIVKATGGTL